MTNSKEKCCDKCNHLCDTRRCKKHDYCDNNRCSCHTKNSDWADEFDKLIMKQNIDFYASISAKQCNQIKSFIAETLQKREQEIIDYIELIGGSEFVEKRLLLNFLNPSLSNKYYG